MSRMDSLQVAIYARTSSELGTIARQLDAMEDRLDENEASVDPDLRFLDEGRCGSGLVRPALTELRQAAARGEFTGLYVASPDRLSRKASERDLLEGELAGYGVDVRYINQARQA